MAGDPPRPGAPEQAAAAAEVSAEQLSKAAEYIEEEEGAFSHFPGFLASATKFLLVAMSLFHLYAAVDIVPANVLRPVHVGWMLLLIFLLVPVSPRYRNRLMWWDVACALLGVATIAYLLAGGDEFWDRNTTPNTSDVFFGVAFVLLVLEACRRTSGWIMVIVISLFLAYAFAGPWLPGQWAHRGYDIDGMTGFLYQTLEGIFGTAVDVSSTLIILFTIYGAFLQLSGAGKFFLDWSFAAMGGKHSGAGRTVVLASFLLGGPSGSGVATTVTIASRASKVSTLRVATVPPPTTSTSVCIVCIRAPPPREARQRQPPARNARRRGRGARSRSARRPRRSASRAPGRSR
jgi:TRAP-type uncharacterized transport system fused permease subunit